MSTRMLVHMTRGNDDSGGGSGGTGSGGSTGGGDDRRNCVLCSNTYCYG